MNTRCLRRYWWSLTALCGYVLHPVGCANIAGIESAKVQSDSATGGASATQQSTDLCTTYCNTVQDGCKDQFSVYASQDTCLGVCAKLVAAGKAGEAGDQSGNTVNCRLTQAQNAKSTGEPGEYCFAAGPGGGDLCGSNCEGYCVLLQQTCPTEFQSAQFNNSLAYCITTACPSVPKLDAGFNADQQAGNNINCRLYHVSAANANADAPGIHCPHAAGAAPCQ